MSYYGKSGIIKNCKYGERIYFDEEEFGTPPPTPPLRYLLQENGFLILQENGNKIELEIGTPVIRKRFLLQENVQLILQENGNKIELE